MPAIQTTTGQVSDAVSAFLDKNLLSRAYAYFVHAMWAQVRDLPRNNSTTIKFRKYGSLSAATTALTEGVTPTGSQLSVTDLTAVPLLYGDFVTLTDYLDMTVVEALHEELSRILGDQMGDTIDQLTRDVMVAGTTIQYSSTSTSRGTVAAGMILTGDEVREAVLTLQNNNAKYITAQIDPSTGFNTAAVPAAYIGIVSAYALRDLKKDPDFEYVQDYASSEGRLGDFEVGRLDNVRFVLAGSNAKVFSAEGAGSIDVHATIIFGQEFYGITRISGEAASVITKPFGSGEDPLNQRMTMGWKISFIAKRLQEAFAVRIEHAVTS